MPSGFIATRPRPPTLPAQMTPLFKNPWPHPEHSAWDILKWKLKLGKRESPVLPSAPRRPAETLPLRREQMAATPRDGWRVTWLGHASFLVQGAGLSLLIDPIFSTHCAPLPIPSLRRKATLPCRIEDLPKIDAILLTHSHYDHLDLPTLRRIGPSTPIWIAKGHACWLRAKGFSQVRELTWSERAEIAPGVQITATPAQHFTARTPWDRNRGHWCGWLIEGAGCRLWHAGDSGFCPAFLALGEQVGPIDFGMIPIGAYQPRSVMRAMHMNPAEAVQAFLDARCRQAVAMHWGTFQLTDEPLGEPPLLLAQALQQRQIPATDFVAGVIGSQFSVLAAPHLRNPPRSSVPGVQ